MDDAFLSEQPTQPIAYVSIAETARQWRLELSERPTVNLRPVTVDGETTRLEVVK